MLTPLLCFLKFVLLISPILIPVLGAAIAWERWTLNRKVRLMKRNFREAYQDWKRNDSGSAEALRCAIKWHNRLSCLRR